MAIEERKNEICLDLLPVGGCSDYKVQHEEVDAVARSGLMCLRPERCCCFIFVVTVLVLLKSESRRRA